MTSKQIQMLVPVALYLILCIWLAVKVGNKQMSAETGTKKHRTG